MKTTQYHPVSQPYLSLEAELYDAFWEAEDPSSELSLIADFLNDHPGKALEMGSGSGRLMLPLNQQGFTIEGLELSSDMIAICRQRADQLGIPTTVHQGDMSSWQSDTPYDSLLAPAFTLQLSGDPLATLSHWSRLLKAGGGLYLTVFMPYAELENEIPENQWYDDHQTTLPDGRTALLQTRHRIDESEKLIHRDHRYSITGESPASYESKQTIRWIDHEEMQTLLHQAGFLLKKHCYDFSSSPIADDINSDDCAGIFTYRAEKMSDDI